MITRISAVLISYQSDGKCSTAIVAGSDSGPYIDSGGTVQNLNTLIPAGSGQIQYATAINDDGQIVANGLLLNPS